MAEERPEGDHLTRASGVFEFAGKVALATIGVTYVIGFLTTTCYLATYGITGVELLQPQYIGAGIWTLMPLAVVGVIYHAFKLDVPVLSFLKVHGGEGWLRKSVKLLGQSTLSVAVLEGVFFAFALNIAWVVAAVGPRFSTPSWPTGITASIIAVVTLAACVFFAVGTFRWSKRFWHESEDAKQRSQFSSWAVLHAFGFAIFFFGWITFFAVFIFGLIPMQIGGGKPMLVQFVLKPGEQMAVPATMPKTQPDESIESYLTPEKSGGRRSMPQWLFLTTDEDYIVYERGVTGSSVFPRSLVNGYVVIRSK